jgi:hypothetical protein
MNVRFAEPCREKALELQAIERLIQTDQVNDGRPQKELALTCTRDIHIGVFFDGTNNNKYRDRPGRSHSNVARLYEAYPGTAAKQPLPKLKDKYVNGKESKARELEADKVFTTEAVKGDVHQYYRKIYVPGLGTPMAEVRDTGTGPLKTAGLAMALMGQVRLDWAMLQLINQVHAAIFKQAPVESVTLAPAFQPVKPQAKQPEPEPSDDVVKASLQALADLWAAQRQATGDYDPVAYEKLLNEYLARLKAALAARGNAKPTLRKIRLSVFGFSRGAAEARAWVNAVTKRFESSLAGIPLQIDFLGVFDTVASVGVVQAVPGFSGHGAWGDSENMAVPANVKRCVHLVSAMELRGSFPLDSVCRQGRLPTNCKEIVYPGVHSDVGGGYPPGDQGRALPQAKPFDDALKLSQIPLAQMYREALMAGVPLTPPNQFLDFHKADFAISDPLRKDFNAYVDATRSGSVLPTLGKGEPQFARMFPTETQPRESLHAIMYRHAGLALSWRKAMLAQKGGAAATVNVNLMTSDAKYQDAEDIRGAEEELKKEIDFLMSHDPKKFEHYDDRLLDALSVGGAPAASLLVVTAPLLVSPVWSFSPGVSVWKALAAQVAAMAGSATATVTAPVAAYLTYKSIRDGIHKAMKDKQREWDTWLKDAWLHAESMPASKRQAISQLMTHYVHDSRAWFKLAIPADAYWVAPDDEDWFVLGGREKERAKRLTKLDRNIATNRNSPQKSSLVNERDTFKSNPAEPLIRGGREPYRMWGYVRMRGIYDSWKPVAGGQYSKEQEQIDREERRRVAIQNEKADFEAQKKRIQDQSDSYQKNPDRTRAEKDELLRISRNQMAWLKQDHEKRMRDLGAYELEPST